MFVRYILYPKPTLFADTVQEKFSPPGDDDVIEKSDGVVGAEVLGGAEVDEVVAVVVVVAGTEVLVCWVGEIGATVPPEIEDVSEVVEIVAAEVTGEEVVEVVTAGATTAP